MSRVVGFKKIKFYTNENVGSGELDLPEQQMHTSSYWLTIPAGVMGALPFGGDDRRDGVVGLAFAMRNVAQLLLMCDRHDIGLSIDGGALDRAPRTGGTASVPAALAAEPNIFIYDNYPGGIGFSDPLFDMHRLLLERTRELIGGCPCDSGCPSCVGPEGNTGPHAKEVASLILDGLLEASRRASRRSMRRRKGSEMDLRSRLRSIVRTDGKPARELTYEPDTGGYEATIEPCRVGEVLGGRPVDTPFGNCLVIDRRYESNRRHGDVFIEDCQIPGADSLRVLDPSLLVDSGLGRTVFIDLETTGISGGAGTVAFLVGCGYFDLGAFQVRQFLLTSYKAERALLAAVADFFDDADLIVTYNGKTFDVPVMETRWMFHRMELPLEGVPHFDALHTARRLWKSRAEARPTTPGAA